MSYAQHLDYQRFKYYSRELIVNLYAHFMCDFTYRFRMRF